MAQSNRRRNFWPPLDNQARFQDLICTVGTQAFWMQDVLDQSFVVGWTKALEETAPSNRTTQNGSSF
ncbi:hypothetical protein BZM27_49790 [Paraburkholderia steynii]|uniref:Uncharacterized protein n=1 Tax=Paraburkholderia steynii TaxID=1245441 RepID=A0A4R0WZV5_9BURK|nr:hypothetical protein BZM27_49790 [Paraburkholderia steynii]